MGWATPFPFNTPQNQFLYILATLIPGVKGEALARPRVGGGSKGEVRSKPLRPLRRHHERRPVVTVALGDHCLRPSQHRQHNKEWGKYFEVLAIRNTLRENHHYWNEKFFPNLFKFHMNTLIYFLFN